MYTAEDPDTITFVPLSRKWMKDKYAEYRDKKITARQLFALLREVSDPCAGYLHLIESKKAIPLKSSLLLISSMLSF